jgi:hypothetical protein
MEKDGLQFVCYECRAVPSKEKGHQS